MRLICFSFFEFVPQFLICIDLHCHVQTEVVVFLCRLNQPHACRHSLFDQSGELGRRLLGPHERYTLHLISGMVSIRVLCNHVGWYHLASPTLRSN